MFDLKSLPQKIVGFGQTLWNAEEKTLKWMLAVLVVVLACFNFIRDIDKPVNGFWDEAYYITAAERYEHNIAQYASHPPLGFMFMDVGQKLWPANKALDTRHMADVKKIGSKDVTPKYNYGPIRLPAGIFSVISALLVYLILLKICGESFEAFVFSLFFLFENAFIVHFRAAHLDAYQMTFTLGAVLVWLNMFGQKPKRPLLTYAIFGLLCGLSFMVKVNSLIMVVLVPIALMRDLWVGRSLSSVVEAAKRATISGCAFVATVVAVFVLHTVLNPVMPDPETEAGRRDLKYMGETYQGWLKGETDLSPTVLIEATKGYYDYMKNDFVGVTASEPNGSQPVMWPFMQRIISYRWDFDGKNTAYVQMIGNPLTWGIGGLCILGGVVLILRRRVLLKANPDGEDLNRLEPLWAMFMIFWVFHIYLGSQRVMYIYHYFIGLVLLYICAALIFRIIARKFAVIDRHRFTILCGLAVAVAGVFLFYAPLTYHQKLSYQACEWRNIPFKAVVCKGGPKAVIATKTPSGPLPKSQDPKASLN